MPRTSGENRPAPGGQYRSCDARAAMTGYSGHSRSIGQANQVLQAVPFSVNAAGTASLLVQVPWKPSEVFAPGAIVPL